MLQVGSDSIVFSIGIGAGAEAEIIEIAAHGKVGRVGGGGGGKLIRCSLFKRCLVSVGCKEPEVNSADTY